MNTRDEPLDSAPAMSSDSDFGVIFHLNYARIARIIARMIDDPGRAEELAAEVFWRFLHNPTAQTGSPRGWLYRTAVRSGLDELRRQQRRKKFEHLLHVDRSNPTPEQLHQSGQTQEQVRGVLSALGPRDTELLILRSDSFSYQEIAEILQLNATSIGTLLRRAQQAFRKEFVKRYGNQSR